MKTLVRLEHEKILKTELAEKEFAELHAFALTEKGREVLMAGPDYVKTRSYVGVIQTRSGLVMEILPKIHDDEADDGDTRKHFLYMLRAMRTLPRYRHIDLSNLNTENMPLYEVFIAMFAREVSEVIKKGIKSDYVTHEDNLACLRGKLVVGEQVRRNAVHRERFCVRYDEYIQDIPRNRILKSALCYCKKVSVSFANRQKINELLFILDAVRESADPGQDYGRIVHDRTSDYYANALAWAMLFLSGKSFTTYAGSSIAFALLFPMEKVFESYVAHCLKRHGGLVDLRTQSSRYYLARGEDDEGIFQIKPDIVAKSGDRSAMFIIDTKWKLIDENQRTTKYGISQADMYQLLSYAKIYESEAEEKLPIRLCMIYPKTASFREPIVLRYNDSAETAMLILPFDIPALVNSEYGCVERISLKGVVI